MKKSGLLFLIIMVLTLTLCSLNVGVCYAEEVSQEVAIEETNSFAEWISVFWANYGDNITNALSSISLGSIVTAVVVAMIKKETTKVANKVDDSRTITKLTDGVVDGIKGAKIGVSILPLVKSEILKTNEVLFNELDKHSELDDKRYLAIVNILKAQAEYFNGSALVSEDSKEKLAKAIYQAENLVEIVEEEVPATIEVAIDENGEVSSEQTIVEM